VGCQTYIFVIIALNPGYQAQSGENLGLDSKGNIEIPRDIIGTQRDTCTCPQKHHRPLKTDGVMSPEVDDNLRDKLIGQSNVSKITKV
jgi:hypothetical protein